MVMPDGGEEIHGHRRTSFLCRGLPAERLEQLAGESIFGALNRKGEHLKRFQGPNLVAEG